MKSLKYLVVAALLCSCDEQPKQEVVAQTDLLKETYIRRVLDKELGVACYIPRYGGTAISCVYINNPESKK